jgi:hypothetical protein
MIQRFISISLVLYKIISFTINLNYHAYHANKVRDNYSFYYPFNYIFKDYFIFDNYFILINFNTLTFDIKYYYFKLVKIIII